MEGKWVGLEDVNARGLSRVTECSVTGRAVRGKGMLRAFKKGLTEVGDGVALGLVGAEGRRGSWKKG